MKLVKYLVVLFFSIAAQAQEYSVEVFPNRYRFSYETVSMNGTEPDLGFVGKSIDIFNFYKENSNIYLGFSTFSAVKGIRPGLITLGISAGWQKKISKNNFYVDLGAFVGGGGGGGADDGGGLILRPHLVLEKRINDLGLRFGVSRIDFPTGSINGNQLNFGITVYGENYLKTEKGDFDNISATKDFLSTMRFAVVGTQYFDVREGSAPERPFIYNNRVSLIGVQIEKDMNPNLYGIFKINGAFHGGADGYMSALLGLGGKLPVWKNKLNLEGRALIGPSGGGAILAGGGATAQFEIGASLYVKNGYDLKFMGGTTYSPWGPFKTSHIELSLGKTLGILDVKKSNINRGKFNIDSSEFKTNHFAVSAFNRTYFPPHKRRKFDNNYYQSYFNLLGFEFQKYFGERFSLNAATVWAYQGDYGAYAEGLFGATYYHPVTKTWSATLKGMFGAAGGGAIDVGTGLLIQYAIGLDKKLNDKSNLTFSFGRVSPLKGNFTPFSFDVGYKFQLHKIFKK